MSVDKAALLSCTTLPTETVTLPGIGAVTVQGMTVGQRDNFESSMRVRDKAGAWQVRDNPQIRARLIAASVVDDTGAKMFGADDLDAINAMSADVAQPLFDVALRVCGMSAEDAAELEKT